jgi:hypothetical protein
MRNSPKGCLDPLSTQIEEWADMISNKSRFIYIYICCGMGFACLARCQGALCVMQDLPNLRFIGARGSQVEAATMTGDIVAFSIGSWDVPVT